VYARTGQLRLQAGGRVSFTDTLQVAAHGRIAGGRRTDTDTVGWARLRYDAGFARDSMVMEAELDNGDISMMTPFVTLPVDVNGRLNARFSMQGATQSPHIRATARAHAVHLAGYALFDSLFARLSLQDTVLHARMTAARDRGEIAVNALVPMVREGLPRPRRDTLVHVSAEKLPLAPWASLVDTSLRLWGTLSCNARIRGMRELYLPEGGLRIAGAGVAIHHTDTIVDRVTLTGRSIGVDSARTAPGNRSREAARSGRTNSGNGTGSFGAIRLSNESPLHTPYGRIATLVLRTRLRTRMVHVDSLYARVQDGSMLLSGRVPVGSGDSVMGGQPSLRVHADVENMPLALVNPLLGNAAAVKKGRLHARGRLRGAATTAQLEGTVAIDSLMVQPARMEPVAGPAFCDISITPDSMVLRRFDTRWGEGRVRAYGGAAWSLARGLQGGTVHVRGGALPLFREPLVRGRIDTTAIEVMVDSTGAVRCRGFVHPGATRIRYTVTPAAPATGMIVQDTSQGVLDRVRMDMRVDVPDSIEVSMMPRGLLEYAGELNTTVGGALRVSGTAARPSIQGRIRGSRGYIRYLGNDFTIDELTLTPAGADVYATRVAMAAHRTIQRGSVTSAYTVRLRLEGTLDRLQTTLTSTPPLSEPEIVSLLVTGSTDPLGINLQELGTLSSEAARRLLSRRMAAFTERKVARVFDLDEVAISGNVLESVQDNGNVSVSLGKQVTRRLRIEYHGEIGSSDEHRSVISYQLLHWLYLDALRDARGNTGVDLRIQLSD
jgi:autotransporter translocation and assembly factor TamB